MKWDLSSAGRASALQAEGHRFEPCRSHSSEKLMELNMARWLNWLERPVHTREVESSSLSLATIQACGHRSQVFLFYKKKNRRKHMENTKSTTIELVSVEE